MSTNFVTAPLELAKQRYHKTDIQKIDQMIKSGVSPRKIYRKWQVDELEDLKKRPPTYPYIYDRYRKNPEYRQGHGGLGGTLQDFWL